MQEKLIISLEKQTFNGKSLLAAAGTDKNISIQLSDVASDNLTITAVDATTGATGLGLTKLLEHHQHL